MYTSLFQPVVAMEVMNPVASNLYVACWIQGLSKGNTNKESSALSKIGYIKKVVNVHGCVWGCELSCETYLDQFTLVMDVYSTNTLARDTFLGRQYLHFNLLTPHKSQKVYPSLPPHDPTVQTYLAYYTQYGYKTTLSLMDKYDTAVFKDYLHLDHVLVMSTHYGNKATNEKTKKQQHTVQGTLTVSYLIVDKAMKPPPHPPRVGSVSMRERPLPLVPRPPPHPPQSPPPHPPQSPPPQPSQSPPPQPPQRGSEGPNGIAVAAKTLPLPSPQGSTNELHDPSRGSAACYEPYDPSQGSAASYEPYDPSQGSAACYEPYDPSQDSAACYEPYDPSERESCYEPYDPSQGGDDVYSTVDYVASRTKHDQAGHTAVLNGSAQERYEPVAAGSDDGKGGCDYEYVRLSHHQPGVMLRRNMSGVCVGALETSTGDGEIEELPQVGSLVATPGMEQDQMAIPGMEQDRMAIPGMEQDRMTTSGVEQDLVLSVEALRLDTSAAPSVESTVPNEDDVYDDVIISCHTNLSNQESERPTTPISLRDIPPSLPQPTIPPNKVITEDVYDDVMPAIHKLQAPPTSLQAPPTPHQAPPLPQTSAPPYITPSTTAVVPNPVTTAPFVHQKDTAAPQATPTRQAPPLTDRTPIGQKAISHVLPSQQPLNQATPFAPPTSCPKKDPEQNPIVRPRPRPPSRCSSNPFLPPVPTCPSPTPHNPTSRPTTPISQSSNPTTQNQATPSQPPPASGDLPPGWEAVSTSDGKVYYVHKQSRVATWDRPFVQNTPLDGPVPPPLSMPVPPPRSVPAPALQGSGAQTNQQTAPLAPRTLQSHTGPSQQAPPTGPSQQAPPTGPSQQAPPTGPSQQAPPTGPSQQAPPTGSSQQAPPTGPSQQAPPTAPFQQVPPTAPSQQAPPTGPSQQAPPTGSSQQALPIPVTHMVANRTEGTRPTEGGTRPTAPTCQLIDIQQQSFVDWNQTLDPDWDIYNANDDNIAMGQTTPIGNNQIPLPSGWEMKQTPEGHVYFLDHSTKRTQWEDPRLQTSSSVNLLQAPLQAPINPLVVSHISPMAAASPFLSPVTSCLGPFPPGWEMMRTLDGHTYYINNQTRQSQWEDPRLLQTNPLLASPQLQGCTPNIDLGLLPAGWEVRRTSGSQVYYMDIRTGHTQWEDPRLQIPMLQSLCYYKQKLAYFRSTLTPAAPSGVLSITVHRDSLLEDSYHTLMNVKEVQQLRWKPKVQFYGDPEVVTDDDGPLRVWFQQLSQIILNPACGLFQFLTSQRPLLQINQDSGLYNPGHLEYFKFFGRVCGLAIYHNMIIDAFFIRPFYKMMLGKKVTFEDMRSVDFKLYTTLGYIMNNVLKTPHLRFSVKNTVFEELQDDLKPDGRNIPVTEQNKKEYVDLMVAWRLVGRVKDQMNAFMKGFSDVISPKLIQVFDERELEYLMGGLPEIDVEDWKRNTEYIGFKATDDVIVWFWKAVSNYDNEMRARLLQFVTGTSNVPKKGFAMLQGPEGLRKFTICKVEDDKVLPRATVSFNLLHLPPYGDQMLVWKMLSTALLELNQS